MLLIHLVLIICLLIGIPTKVLAKKQCKPLQEKLQNIQALQRHGYSVKRGLSLREREDKAREKWWKCENGHLNKKHKLTKKSHKKQSKAHSQIAKNSYKPLNINTPFKTTRAIVIKSKYQGERKKAWFAFYHQPKECIHPKNLSVFASCSENRRTQQKNFESLSK